MAVSSGGVAVPGDGGVAACLAGVLGNCHVLEGVATMLGNTSSGLADILGVLGTGWLTPSVTT